MTDFLTANYARFPVEFVRGEGARLWDAGGEEYLDFLCGISVSSVGHCHPGVVAAIQRQAAQLLHVGNLYWTEPMRSLAERLARGSLGPDARVFFANSGAEAVEAALKCARKAQQGGRIISLHQGFHGRTYGALSATPQESKQAPFAPLVPGFEAVPASPDALHAAFAGSPVAALLLEPVQGESGVHVLADELLWTARELCDEHGAALIFDEVQSGLGRTGYAWAYEHSGVVPDVLTCAKPLGGGLPIGALICGPRFADVFEPGDHGSTFAGGPLVCAAAHAALDVLWDEELLRSVVELGELLQERLAALPYVKSVRGRGLMVACELSVNAPALVRRALLEQKLIVNATGPSTLRLLPPLVISRADADEAVRRLEQLA